jgi:uncharacterized integral membrane protein
MSWKVVIFLLLAALLAIFTFQNQIALDIKILKWELKEVPVVYLILVGLIFGFLLSTITQLPVILRLRRELRNVVRELEESEQIEPVPDDEVGPEGVSMGKDYKGGFFNE